MKQVIVIAFFSLLFTSAKAQVLMSPGGARMKMLRDTIELSKFIDSLYQNNQFSGSVIISKKQHVIYSRIRGLADKKTKQPITSSTLFNLGSMNKMFTGIAVMQLVEKGKISLKDPVSKYLPDYPDQAWAKKATIENLLSHTSGLGEFIPFDHKIKDLFNLKEVTDTIATCVKATAPGTELVYSNAGFYLLGYIIEKVAGTSYFAYINKFVLSPAGMKHTLFDATKTSEPIAKGYFFDRSTKTLMDNERIVVKKGGPAGGAYSCIADLMAFENALKTNKLISENSLKDLTTQRAQGRFPGIGYGLGMGVGSMLNGVKWIGHNGGAPGISVDYTWFKDTDYSVIVLTNQDSLSNMPLMMNLKVLVSEMK